MAVSGGRTVAARAVEADVALGISATRATAGGGLASTVQA